MARPLNHNTGDVVAIGIDGLAVAWCDGVFAGDAELVANARLSALVSRPVELFRCTVTAGSTTVLGALAAMASWNPGRTVIVQCPESVDAYFEENEQYV